MPMQTQPPKKRSRLFSLFLWHRYIGLVAAVFVILLSITGIMLNHTSQLSLDHTPVKSAWILSLYNIEIPEPVSFKLETHTLSQLGDQLFINETPVGESASRLVGGIDAEGMIVAAFAAEVRLYTTDAELVEKLSLKRRMNTPLSAVGKNADGHLILLAGGQAWRTDTLFEKLIPVNPAAATFIAANTTLNNAVRKQLERHYAGHDITLERVTLDLHSGRLFGAFGVVVADIAAILLIILAASGVWLWGLRKLKARLHHRHPRKHPRHKHKAKYPVTTNRE